jgi:hypothetical protein
LYSSVRLSWMSSAMRRSKSDFVSRLNMNFYPPGRRPHSLFSAAAIAEP